MFRQKHILLIDVLLRVVQVVSQQSEVCVFRAHTSVWAFFDLEDCDMELNYFKDILFDLLNESDELDVADIQSDDTANTFLVSMKDGTSFLVQVSAAKINFP